MKFLFSRVSEDHPTTILAACATLVVLLFVAFVIAFVWSNWRGAKRP
ncbi:MAG: hypothetical protein WB992_04510 [Bryobacteraceae bacterium]